MVNTSYPFTGKRFDRNGLSLHYLDEGNGDPVLMVHGNPSWSFYYRNLVSRLRGSYRAIAPDHIGCGLSDKPGDKTYRYTLQSRVDDLEALVDSLDLERKLTLVLHDWGGMIGMALAVRRPERIGRIVVLNTAAFGLPDDKPLPLPVDMGRNSILGAVLIRGFNAFARGTAWIGCQRQRMPKELRDAYCAPYDSWKNRIATLRFVQDIPLQAGDPAFAIVKEVEENLHRFSEIPMLICWGMKDIVFDEHFLAGWEQRFPGAEIHRFDDCGHYILEDAVDEVIPLIESFLAANPLTAKESR